MGCVKAVFYTFKVMVGEISPRVIKFCTIIGTVCYSLGNLYQIFDKRKQPAVVKFMNIDICRLFQVVF